MKIFLKRTYVLTANSNKQLLMEKSQCKSNDVRVYASKFLFQFLFRKKKSREICDNKRDKNTKRE